MIIQSVKVLRCRPSRFLLVVLLTHVLTLCKCIQGCTPGWFGIHCEFQCHCKATTGCIYDGDCHPCLEGYFGQKCQYVNEAFYLLTPNTIYTDGNENTCASNSIRTVFEGVLKKKISLTWFRIIARNNDNLLNFTMTWNGNITCGINRKFIVDNRTVDGTCDVPINVHSVRIEGPVVGSLCEFKLSGGTYLSRSGTTGQTSKACTLCGSDKAVDNIPLADDPSHRCAITNEETNPPEWFLNFFQPHFLHTVVLIAHEDDPAWHLGYVVKVNTSTGIEVILAKIQDELRVLRFIMKPQWHNTEVVQLSVTQDSNNRGNKKQLVICELGAYGYIACSKNTYGLNCTECNCSDTEACNPYTGGCCAACPVGFYGDNCTLMCPTNCLDDVCTFENGTCPRCKPGYEGETCTNECKENMYGQDCMENCSEFCIGECDHVTGDCSSCNKNRLVPRCIECPAGFYGTQCSYACPVTCDRVCEVYYGECFWCIGHFFGRFCEDCADGYYGEKCELDCPKMCVKKKCDRLSGDCLNCLGSRIGAKCEGIPMSADCEDHFYGLQCDQKCSKFCFNESCDHVTGKCNACKKGYHGEICSTVPEKPALYTAGLSLLPLALLIFFLMPDCGNDSDEEEDTTSSW